MSRIRLLLDEDVRVLLGELLRNRGFDAVHVLDLDRGGLPDSEHLDFAIAERRTILTHNIRDFILLDRKYRAARRPHWGILASDQVPFGELLRRTLRLLSRRTDEDVQDQLVWLHEFKMVFIASAPLPTHCFRFSRSRKVSRNCPTDTPSSSATKEIVAQGSRRRKRRAGRDMP